MALISTETKFTTGQVHLTSVLSVLSLQFLPIVGDIFVMLRLSAIKENCLEQYNDHDAGIHL